MKFAPTLLNGLILAGLLATTGAAMAQGTDAAPAGLKPTMSAPAAQNAGSHQSEQRMGRHDPVEMQARMARHQAELKAKLKITPAQESAWTAFTTTMQPPARVMNSERSMVTQRAELDALSTPERIDKMKALRTQHMTEMNAEMDTRGEAVKTFYAALSPEQKNTFDAEHRKMGGHRGGGRGHHDGDGMRHKD
jgi:hypothetical protein